MIDINTISIPRSTSRSSVDGVAWCFISHGDDDEGLEINRDFKMVDYCKLVGLIRLL